MRWLGWLPVLALALVSAAAHEAAHAGVARLFGDRTAEEAGRLTLNPFRHIDLFATVLLPLTLLLMGYPPLVMFKPVPVGMGGVGRRRLMAFCVGVAGPAANVLLALAAAAVFRLGRWGGAVGEVWGAVVALNLMMAGFNLLPVPPLDGSWVLMSLLPRSWAVAFARQRTTFVVVLLFLLFSGWLGRLLGPFWAVLEAVRRWLMGV